MSWDALKIAATAKCRTPTAKLVLIMIANYADENYSSYPSIAKLSELCGCDERTIKRAIKILQEDGQITVTARFRHDGKQTSNSFTIQRNGGDIFEGVGVTNMTPNTTRDIPINNNKQKGDKKDPPKKYPPEFNEWWNAYPRKDGSKKKAFTLWKEAIDKDIDSHDLFLKTCRFAQLQHGKDKKFIPHATTWLSQGRWETVDETRNETTNRNQLAG